MKYQDPLYHRRARLQQHNAKCLHPRHGGDEAGRRRHHRERHQSGDVSYAKKSAETCTSEKHEKAAKISAGQGKSCPVLSNPFRSFPLMGHGLGQTENAKI